MVIDLLPITGGDTKSYDFSFSTSTAAEGAADYLSGLDITGEGEVLVSGNVRDMAGCLMLEMQITVKYGTNCSRCFKEAKGEFSIPVSCNIVAEDKDEDGSCIVADGRYVYLDDTVFSEILMNFPQRTLCREDCRGLCPVCGTDLNEKDCECTVG